MSAIPTVSHVPDLDEPPLKIAPSLCMTEEEFVAWAKDDVRAEWVYGEVILMPPVSLTHTRQTRWLSTLLSEFIERRHLGELLGPEFLIRLGTQRRRRLPDLLFVSSERQAQLRPNHLEGGPDLAHTLRPWNAGGLQISVVDLNLSEPPRLPLRSQIE